MGFGDEIMASAEARLARMKDPRRVAILDRAGKPRWSDIWRNNPNICDPSHMPYSYQTIVNGPGARPYIESKTDERWSYTNWQVPCPGELFLDDDEIPNMNLYGSFVVIEPHIKANASPNKQWGFERWQECVKIDAGSTNFVQMSHGLPLLEGVRSVKTSTFRHACGVLSQASLFVGPEGGMHHAAAALGIGAVVWFGGMTSPDNTGYRTHRNLHAPIHPDSPCGSREPCAHCETIASAFTPMMMAEMIQAENEK